MCHVVYSSYLRDAVRAVAVCALYALAIVSSAHGQEWESGDAWGAHYQPVDEIVGVPYSYSYLLHGELVQETRSVNIRVYYHEGTNTYRVNRRPQYGGSWTTNSGYAIERVILGGTRHGEVEVVGEGSAQWDFTHVSVEDGAFGFRFRATLGKYAGMVMVQIAIPTQGYTVTLEEQCNQTDRAMVAIDTYHDGAGAVVEREVHLIGAGGCAPRASRASREDGMTAVRTWRETDGSAPLPGAPEDQLAEAVSAERLGEFDSIGGFDLEKWRSEQYAGETWDAGSYVDEAARIEIGNEVDPVARIREHNDDVRHREAIAVSGEVVRAIRENTVSTGARLDRVEVAIGGIEIEGGSGGGGGDTDVSGIEDRLDQLIDQGEAIAAQHEEALEQDGLEGMLLSYVQAAGSQLESAMAPYAPSMPNTSVPGGSGGAWAVTIGSYGTFDLNPLSHPDIANAAELCKRILAWLIFAGYALWVFREFSRAMSDVLKTPQVKGTPVFGGTGAQVAGLICAGLALTLILLVPAGVFAAAATGWGSFTIFDLGEPLAGVTMTSAVSMGWYLVCAFVPVDLVFWVAASMVVGTFAISGSVRVVQLGVKLLFG